MPLSVRTYSAAVSITLAGNPTDVFTLSGAANTTIELQELRVSGLATTAGAAIVSLVQRSSLDTGGTSTSVPAVPHSSTFSAAAGSCLAYTANPTLGTLVGALRAERIMLPLAGTATSFTTYKFADQDGMPPALVSADEQFAVNLDGVAPVGTALTIYAEWTEV